MTILGFHENGGLAEYSLVPESSLIDVPKDLPDHIACLAEPLSCTLNALKMADVEKGQSVLIFGAGPVGLLMAMAVTYKGAKPFMLEINDKKLEQSHKFREILGISVADDFAGLGFDAAINAAPSPDTFLEGIGKLRSGGCFCVFSGLMPADDISASEIMKAINEIHYRQLRVTGAYGCTSEQIALSLDILNAYQDTANLLIERYIRLEDVAGVLPEILSGSVFKYVVKIQH
jgi:threonine dehydrogenase-like Zn-dependent dehydrogenase